MAAPAPSGRARVLRAGAPRMRAALGSPALPRADPPFGRARDPSANRARVAPEKRSRVRRLRRPFCKPTSLFRCRPNSVCRRPAPKPPGKRWTDFRLRKFMNFRTFPRSDPEVFRLSCTKVRELSNAKIGPPRRTPGKQRGRPPKGAGRCGTGCQRESGQVSDGAAPPERRRRNPRRSIETKRGRLPEGSRPKRTRLCTRKRGRAWRVRVA